MLHRGDFVLVSSDHPQAAAARGPGLLRVRFPCWQSLWGANLEEHGLFLSLFCRSQHTVVAKCREKELESAEIWVLRAGPCSGAALLNSKKESWALGKGEAGPMEERRPGNPRVASGPAWLWETQGAASDHLGGGKVQGPGAEVQAQWFVRPVSPPASSQCAVRTRALWSATGGETEQAGNGLLAQAGERE